MRNSGVCGGCWKGEDIYKSKNSSKPQNPSCNFGVKRSRGGWKKKIAKDQAVVFQEEEVEKRGGFSCEAGGIWQYLFEGGGIFYLKL